MYKKNLLKLGVPANLRGFEYLNYAIGVYKPTQRMMDLYRAVAKEYGITTSQAERSMRHAVSKTIRDITVGAFVAECKVVWDDPAACLNAEKVEEDDGMR